MKPLTIEQIENPPPCPSCGRQLEYFDDPIGDGFQCAGLDCLETFEVGEVIEVDDVFAEDDQ